MPGRKSKELEVRLIAFSKLHAEGRSRLEVMERLGVSQAGYYRLLSRFKRGRAVVMGAAE